MLAVLALLASAAACADVRLGYLSTRGHGDLATLSIAGGRLRLDPDRNSPRFDADSSAIIDPRNSQVLVLDRGEHQFTRIDGNTLNQLAGVAGIASLLGAETTLQLRVQSRGAGEAVHGHACTLFRVDLNGVHTADYCMADAAGLGFSAADLATLQRAMDSARGLLQALGAQLGNGVFAGGRVPVRLVSYHDGRVSGISEFSQSSSDALPARDFAIPPGYREQPIDPTLFAPQ